MDDFTHRYLTINNHPNAPECSAKIVESFREQLNQKAPELDFLPYIFEVATCDVTASDEFCQIVQQFSASFLIIWPSIGGPWCTPAQLYLAHKLEEFGFENGDSWNTRDPIGPKDEAAAKEFLNKQYGKSTDKNLKNMLGMYCKDFDTVLQTVALGYCHVGVTKSGVLREVEVDLILAAAIIASGATRSAKIHGKAALVIGNSLQTVQAVYETAFAINEWNGTPVAKVDVGVLAAELKTM